MRTTPAPNRTPNQTAANRLLSRDCKGAGPMTSHNPPVITKLTPAEPTL
ncbi:MAG: hypothetical protein JWN34_3958 [Bryobacterales bacterium]|jgi:hypothetical protein|nr:hypothetical protein [Bryobacterales bacterium]